MISMWISHSITRKENKLMHDFVVALAFVGLLIAPAIVAARSGKNQAE